MTTTIVNQLQRLSLFLTAEEVPEWVKSASIGDLDSADENDASAFADSSRRQLPVHTKVATFFSSIVFGLNPQDYGNRQSLISSKLAQMQELHGIETDEVINTVNAIRTAERVESCEQVAQKLAGFAKSVAASTKNPGDFVRAARHLQSNGVNNEFVQDWAFTQPRQGIKKAMLGIAYEFGNAEARKLASAASSATHERAQELLPELLDHVDLGRIGSQQVHSKLATLPILEEFDCRICDHDYPDTTIRAKIGELALATNLPIVGRFITAPTAGYREQLQTAPRELQRLAQNCL